jgi:hypothetical protein
MKEIVDEEEVPELGVKEGKELVPMISNSQKQLQHNTTVNKDNHDDWKKKKVTNTKKKLATIK